MVPHDIETASGDTHSMYMVPLENLTRHLFEDPSYACELVFSATRAEGADGEHQYGSMRTSAWYQRFVQRLPKAAVPFVFDLFSDGSVRQSSGAKYHEALLAMSNLPRKQRFMTKNLVMWAIVPLIPKKTVLADKRLMAMTPAQRKTWLQLERSSLSRGAYDLMLRQVDALRAGKPMRSPFSNRSTMVVPAIGCFQLDVSCVAHTSARCSLQDLECVCARLRQLSPAQSPFALFAASRAHGRLRMLTLRLLRCGAAQACRAGSARLGLHRA